MCSWGFYGKCKKGQKKAGRFITDGNVSQPISSTSTGGYYNRGRIRLMDDYSEG